MSAADRERIEALIRELRALERASVEECFHGNDEWNKDCCHATQAADLIGRAVSQLSALSEALSAAHEELARLKATTT